MRHITRHKTATEDCGTFSEGGVPGDYDLCDASEPGNVPPEDPDEVPGDGFTDDATVPIEGIARTFDS